MKIIIVTVFRSTNCGSYWQAHALKKWLENRGHEVNFLDLRIDRMQVFSDVVCNIRGLNIKAAKNILKSKTKFSPYFKKMNLVGALKAKKIKYDLEIVGGDEIWNMSRSKFHDISIRGLRIYADNVISYAPSINGAERKDFQTQDASIYFNNFNAISVRDFYSQRILGEYTNAEIKLVLDPTFLFDKKDYERITVPLRRERFLLLYVASDIQEEWAKEIQKLCREENLVIISYGWIQKFADENIIADPYSFIQYFLEAEYIVTNTFHGTVFSINFRKKFVDIDANSQKVKELLKEFECEERQNRDPVIAMETLKEDLNIERIEELQSKYVSESEEYLLKNLGEF